MEKIKTGVELIADERKEQIEKHGRKIQSDLETNSICQLSNVARLLLLNTGENSDIPISEKELSFAIPGNWDKNVFSKMFNKTYKERLVISGALIAAELDRLNALGE